jgi:hypothetical protein
MLWAKSDRVRGFIPRAIVSAFFLLSFTIACFAQEPPLDIPPSGVLPGLPSAGCDPGVDVGPGGNSKTGSASTHRTTSDLGVPLYSIPDAGTNVPLSGNPLAGDNVPLYSIPDPGSSAPLYSNTSLSKYSDLSGGSTLNPVNNAGPTACRSGIPVGQWLLYPSIRLYSILSDNLFLSPSSPVNAPGFGATPSVIAAWTNGIHSTNLYASVDTELYPTNNLINKFDRQVTFTQTYAPLPDLTFTVLGDYSHTTVTGSLTNSIPDVTASPVATATLLPNGNTQLPNGNIVSPTGQVVGNINGPSGANGISVVNPFDTYTGTATVSKIFNRGILTLSASSAQTDYATAQNPGTAGAFTSFTTNTFRENSSFWLGPVFYAFSNGTFSTRANGEGTDPNSQVYTVQGGIGTRQFGLFRSSVYLGYQGSNSDGSGPSGGQLYGANISYYPSLAWTITAALDETVNKATAGAASTQALAVSSPEQIALSSSTRITHPSLQTQYQISPQWTATGNFSYTQIDFIGSSRIDHAWETDAQLAYEIWRNMTLSWEYQYTLIQSNAPGNNAQRNLLTMSANYRF